ncbi:MAG TPA: peptidylprolyl isomerase [Pyrinomonadaceae bacterium]|jgi:peptidylprolyl isomerase|nr:peptidylprolyl isomerase [Pyrinomonadaceae bacterium]
MKQLPIFLLALCAAVTLSCGGTTNKASNLKNAPADIKKGVTPLADPEVAVIEMENSAAYGTITIELYSNIAPKMVARFKELANSGVYDGVTWHRVNESVIQSGDPLSKDGDPKNDGTGKSDKPNVDAEFSDLKYDTGIVGAARGQDNNSANSQFFITLKREQGFDNRYTIFGKVIDGMQNVRTIAGVQPKDGERPLEAIRIKHISIVSREQAK